MERDTIEELKEGQKAVYRQLKNISEQLETLSGRQQVSDSYSVFFFFFVYNSLCLRIGYTLSSIANIKVDP